MAKSQWFRIFSRDFPVVFLCISQPGASFFYLDHHLPCMVCKGSMMQWWGTDCDPSNLNDVTPWTEKTVAMKTPPAIKEPGKQSWHELPVGKTGCPTMTYNLYMHIYIYIYTIIYISSWGCNWNIWPYTHILMTIHVIGISILLYLGGDVIGIHIIYI